MSTDRDNPMEGHIRLDDFPVGPYKARLEIVEGPYSHENVTRHYTVNLSELVTLRQHLDNAIDALRERQVRDVAAGDCAICDNLRMVQVEKHGRPWTEHCPECQPRTEAVEQALREGHPPARA